MFVDACGLIFADDKRIQLGELTVPRALAAVPFGGRYRIIDFMLSNMVNTGITHVGVSTFNKYKSLMDHLGTGSPWDLDRKTQGLSILPPYLTTDTYTGANDLAGILNFFRSTKRKYIVVCGSSAIFNMPFNYLIDAHEQSGADITLLYNRETQEVASPNIVLEFDRKNKLKGMLLDPTEETPPYKSFLGVMVMERELFLNILAECLSRGIDGVDFLTFIKMRETLNIRGHEFKGTVLRIQSIQTYFTSTMKSLSPACRRALYTADQPVYTKVKDESPTYYSAESKVSGCSVSDGCIIEGELTNSLLFRGVSIAPGAKIKNCIIFQNAIISEGCELENCIIDKNAHIRPGIKLIGQEGYPVVIGKGAIV